MKLKEVKNWIDILPENFLEFEVVIAEECKVDDDDENCHYRFDKILSSLNVVESSNEILFMSLTNLKENGRK